MTPNRATDWRSALRGLPVPTQQHSTQKLKNKGNSKVVATSKPQKWRRMGTVDVNVKHSWSRDSQIDMCGQLQDSAAVTTGESASNEHEAGYDPHPDWQW
jgi:hypothetical protein